VAHVTYSIMLHPVLRGLMKNTCTVSTSGRGGSSVGVDWPCEEINRQLKKGLGKNVSIPRVKRELASLRFSSLVRERVEHTLGMRRDRDHVLASKMRGNVESLKEAVRAVCGRDFNDCKSKSTETSDITLEWRVPKDLRKMPWGHLARSGADKEWLLATQNRYFP
jgi:hypothetical protein